jgi:predicted transcriptional regulator
MKEIERLKEENEDLKTKLIDLAFEMNYNKQNELIEFLREIYDSVKSEISDEHSLLSKRDVLFSLQKYIEEFAKDNHIAL